MTITGITATNTVLLNNSNTAEVEAFFGDDDNSDFGYIPSIEFSNIVFPNLIFLDSTLEFNAGTTTLEGLHFIVRDDGQIRFNAVGGGNQVLRNCQITYNHGFLFPWSAVHTGNVIIDQTRINLPDTGSNLLFSQLNSITGDTFINADVDITDGILVSLQDYESVDEGALTIPATYIIQTAPGHTLNMDGTTYRGNTSFVVSLSQNDQDDTSESNIIFPTPNRNTGTVIRTEQRNNI